MSSPSALSAQDTILRAQAHDVICGPADILSWAERLFLVPDVLESLYRPSGTRVSNSFFSARSHAQLTLSPRFQRNVDMTSSPSVMSTLTPNLMALMASEILSFSRMPHPLKFSLLGNAIHISPPVLLRLTPTERTTWSAQTTQRPTPSPAATAVTGAP